MAQVHMPASYVLLSPHRPYAASFGHLLSRRTLRIWRWNGPPRQRPAPQLDKPPPSPPRIRVRGQAACRLDQTQHALLCLHGCTRAPQHLRSDPPAHSCMAGRARANKLSDDLLYLSTSTACSDGGTGRNRRPSRHHLLSDSSSYSRWVSRVSVSLGPPPSLSASLFAFFRS